MISSAALLHLLHLFDILIFGSLDRQATVPGKFCGSLFGWCMGEWNSSVQYEDAGDVNDDNGGGYVSNWYLIDAIYVRAMAMFEVGPAYPYEEVSTDDVGAAGHTVT